MKTEMLFVTAALSLTSNALAVNLIVNGGFETGNFSGWTSNTLSPSGGAIFPSNLTTGSGLPFSGSPAPGPATGSWYAAVDQGGPGGYELSQNFTVAASQTVTYSFDLFGADYSGSAPLNPTYFSNTYAEQAQYARVDILDSAGLILANLAIIGTQPWVNYTGDISAVVAAGGTFTFRFRHFDDLFFYSTALDDVHVDTGGVIPLPTAASLGFAGLAGLGLRRRR